MTKYELATPNNKGENKILGFFFAEPLTSETQNRFLSLVPPNKPQIFYAQHMPESVG